MQTKHIRQAQCKLVHEVRAVKSKTELANIISAQRISEEVLWLTIKQLKTGVSELEIANYIKKSFVKLGAPVLSFPPIVAFGKNSANIHHEPGNSKLKKGDTIMFDFGTTVDHYCSDMTRTYFWGEPNAKQKKVYLDVLKAQELAFKKIQTGEKRAGVIDSTARKYLAKKYKDNFKHGLGHGVGTVIHEWPNFKPKSEDILPVGCVMTIEPGIYLPGSHQKSSGGQVGGVRIEDMYLITKNGAKCLTNVPKSLKDAILK